MVRVLWHFSTKITAISCLNPFCLLVRIMACKINAVIVIIIITNELIEVTLLCEHCSGTSYGHNVYIVLAAIKFN